MLSKLKENPIKSERFIQLGCQESKQRPADHKPLKRPLPHLRAAPYREGQHAPGHHWGALPHEAIGKKSTSLLWRPSNALLPTIPSAAFFPTGKFLYADKTSYYCLRF